MGGRNKAAENRQDQISQQQINLSNRALDKSERDDKLRMDLMQPTINFHKAVTSGDTAAMETAMAPLIMPYTESFKQAREQIYNNVEAGPARDYALSQIERDKARMVGSLPGQVYLTSLDKIANLGSGLGSFSLNELGAGISGLNSAANTNAQVIQAATQRKAANMGALGGLAQGIGSAVGGGLAGGGGGGGGGASPLSRILIA